MGKWVIVEGSTGRLCVVTEEMHENYLTNGRNTNIHFECAGILAALKKLHEYEKETGIQTVDAVPQQVV